MTDVIADEAAERAVIGSILLAPNTIPDVLERMSSADFYYPKHKVIFDVAASMYAEGEPVDSQTVASELARRGLSRESGGDPTYPFTCTQDVPTATNVTYYAGAVFDKARLRRLDQLCTRGKQLVFDGGELAEVVEAFEHLLVEADLQKASKAEGFDDLFEDWVEWKDSPEQPLPTPWPRLNEVFGGGLQRQRMYLVAARPGSGKSVSGLNIGLQVAKAGFTTLVFSLEMPKVEVMSRVLANGATANFKQIISRNLDKENLVKIQQWHAGNTALQTRFLVDDNPNHTIESIAQECRAKKRTGLDFVFIDYAGLITATDSKQQSWEKMGWISKMARRIARTLDCVVLMACQLNRNNPKGVPSLEDLRQSGDLEQDADAVIFLSRPEDHTPMIKMTVAKNRTGELATIDLPENFHCQRIGPVYQQDSYLAAQGVPDDDVLNRRSNGDQKALAEGQ